MTRPDQDPTEAPRGPVEAAPASAGPDLPPPARPTTIVYACAACGEHEGQRFRWTTCHGWTCYCCDPSGHQRRVGYQTVRVPAAKVAGHPSDDGGVA